MLSFLTAAKFYKMENKKYNVDTDFEFRNVLPDEALQTSEIEYICFTPNEACSEKMMVERVNSVPELFLVAVDKATGKIAGFLNGLATDELLFRDEFFSDASLHDPNGQNVLLLGLDVLPEYRGNGLARKIVSLYAEREKAKGRKFLTLTCVEGKIKMYEKMGFVLRGRSASVWGGTEWYEMVMTL